LYAQWSLNEYSIRYELNGGTLDGETDTVEMHCCFGDTITLPEPSRDGYTFDYWKGSRYDAGDKYTVEGDHTFTAQWKKNDDPEPGPEPKPDPDPDPEPKPDPNPEPNPEPGPRPNPNQGNGSGPNSGDNSHILVWMILLTTSAALAGAVVVLRRRKTD